MSNSTEVQILQAPDVAVAFLTYFTVAFCVILTFALLRHNKFYFTRVFYPLYPHESLNDYEKSKRKGTVPPPKSNLFTYLLSNDREKDVLEHAGLDAYITLRATRLPMIVFFAWTLFAFAFLVGPYASASKDSSLVLFQRVTLSAIDKGDEEIIRWVFACVVFIDFLLMYLIKKEYEHFSEIRGESFAKKSKESYSIVVERVPAKLMSKKMLTRYFEALMGQGSVRSITLVPTKELTTTLKSLIDKRESILLKLEMEVARNEKKKKKRSVFKFDVDYLNILAQLKTFKIERNGNKAGFDQEDVDGADPFKATISNRVAKLIHSQRAKTLDAIAKQEAESSWFTIFRKIFLFFSCGYLKKRYRSQLKAVKVDAENYYRAKLDTLNLLIPLLQQRAEILLQNRDEDEIGVQNAVEVEPTFEEYENLLNNDEKDMRIVTLEEQALSPHFWTRMLETYVWEPKKSTDPDVLKRQEIERDIELLMKYVHFSAFVTFNSKVDANIAASISVDSVRDALRATPARKPDAMLYDHLNYSSLYKSLIGVVSLVLLLTFIAFFATYVAFIAYINDLRNLFGSDNSVLAFWFENEYFFFALLQLAPFLLITSFRYVPMIFTFILNLGKPVSSAELNASFFTGYYYFAVIQIFLFFQASSTVTRAAEELLDDPLSIIDFLASVIPNNALFFMQFIMIRCFLTIPVELCRASRIFLGIGMRFLFTGKRYLSQTNRERRKTKFWYFASPESPGKPFLAQLNGFTMLIYTIGISYSVIAPVMSLICLGYSVLFTMVWRNQFLFIYATDLKKSDTFGSQFMQLMDTYFVAMFLMTGTMTGILTLLEAPDMALAGVLLLIFIFVIRRYFLNVYTKEFSTIPLSLAKFNDLSAKKDRLDRRYQDNPDEQKKKDDDEVYDYNHPVLKAEKQIEL